MLDFEDCINMKTMLIHDYI